MKRVFLIVLDSFGIGEEPDASEFGDFDVNTLRSVSGSPCFYVPNLARLGLFQIDGVETAKSGTVATEVGNPERICKAAGEAGNPEGTRTAAGGAGEREERPLAALARLRERSRGKDTTIGHWEIAGVVSEKPLPTYPNGFPEEILAEFRRRTGRGVLCNKPYSGTEVIRDYGEEHLRTGDLIVYTSADSVFQIAAHEEKVPLEELYEDCRIAREILQGEHGVGRVIARPFEGPAEGPFTRTPHRHDFSLLPPEKTMLDHLQEAGKAVIAVGKINDIFAGRGITEAVYTSGNREGIEKTLEYLEKDFEGLCFVNLVDFDMLYGHRRDVDGYAGALSEFDRFLPEICKKIGPEDLLMITADHGCDPAYRATTDHTREYVPLLMYSPGIEPVNYGTRDTFADVAATVLKVLSVPGGTAGESLL